MTGTNDNRPDFRRMIRDSAKKSWDFILVYKLDRFSHNKYETAIHKKTLKDNEVKVLSAMENIPETPEGIILESLLEGIPCAFDHTEYDPLNLMIALFSSWRSSALFLSIQRHLSVLFGIYYRPSRGKSQSAKRGSKGGNKFFGIAVCTVCFHEKKGIDFPPRA